MHHTVILIGPDIRSAFLYTCAMCNGRFYVCGFLQGYKSKVTDRKELNRNLISINVFGFVIFFYMYGPMMYVTSIWIEIVGCANGCIGCIEEYSYVFSDSSIVNNNIMAVHILFRIFFSSRLFYVDYMLTVRNIFYIWIGKPC